MLLRLAGYGVHPECTPLHEAVHAAQRLQLDFAIVDAPTGSPQELESIRAIVKELGTRPVIVVTSHATLAQGALMHIGAAICVARDGEHAAVLGAIHASHSPESHVGSELTPREREILWLLKAGSSTKEIAATLGLSVRTVDFHRANIKQKLQLRSGAELIAFASRNS